jgi:hypothetical protein
MEGARKAAEISRKVTRNIFKGFIKRFSNSLLVCSQIWLKVLLWMIAIFAASFLWMI